MLFLCLAAPDECGAPQGPFYVTVLVFYKQHCSFFAGFIVVMCSGILHNIFRVTLFNIFLYILQIFGIRRFDDLLSEIICDSLFKSADNRE